MYVLTNSLDYKHKSTSTVKNLREDVLKAGCEQVTSFYNTVDPVIARKKSPVQCRSPILPVRGGQLHSAIAKYRV